MCGISGILSLDGSHIKREDIVSMNELIIHRGPDDTGVFIDDDFGLGLGHQRLAIIDLSEDGKQPMQIGSNYTIIYNGEIYNYIEIKKELCYKGYNFKTKTDTEVIVKAYIEWGTRCVERFNGMWAFAIFDKKKKLLFCSRDRFGVKPFYYTEFEGKFIFGSEIKQLLKFRSQNSVNFPVLINYLVAGFENYSSETFFNGICELKNSCNLIFELEKNRNFKISKYYDIPFSMNQEETEEKSIKTYRDVLFNSVNLRLRSDVRVGTCLSGGLDSSSVACIASYYFKKENKKITAIHAKSTSKETDESHYAKIVAEHCNIDLKIITPTRKQFQSLIKEVVYTQEEPFGSPSVFMQYLVMKKAKKLNCTVMLDGQGGDETLLGYERYYTSYLSNIGFFSFFKAFFKSSKNSKLSLFKLLQYYFYFSYPRIRIKRLQKKSSFLKSKYLSLLNKNYIFESSNSFKNVWNMQYLEISRSLPHLLRYEDRNSMRHSIETRLPFIDFQVLEKAINTSLSYKIKNGWTKHILRKVLENLLPKSVIWRKNKLGFEAPTEYWIKSISEDIKKEVSKSKIINKISNKIDFSKLSNVQIWRLYNVAIWEKVFNVKS